MKDSGFTFAVTATRKDSTSSEGLYLFTVRVWNEDLRLTPFVNRAMTEEEEQEAVRSACVFGDSANYHPRIAGSMWHRAFPDDTCVRSFMGHCVSDTVIYELEADSVDLETGTFKAFVLPPSPIGDLSPPAADVYELYLKDFAPEQ